MNLTDELKTGQVGHLDLSAFCQVESGTPVRQVVELMREKGVKVCLVTEEQKLVGIFTVRDVVRNVTAAPESWEAPIETVMTADPITIPLDASAAEALWLMDEKHVRNLPAIGRSGTIVGNMTHRTIINYLAARFPIEILNRPPLPDQFPERAEGG